MNQSFVGLLKASVANSTALASSTSQTTILPLGAIYLLPPNFIDYVGKSFRVLAFGRMSTVVTTPGTFAFTLKVGTVNAATTGAIALNTTAQTNASWWLDWSLTVVTVGGGTACTLMHAAHFTSRAIIGSVAAASGGNQTIVLPDTAPAAGTGFDETAQQSIDLQGTWSISNASNSILTHSYKLYSEN